MGARASIRNRLLSAPAVPATVGTRIYHKRVPPDGTFPCIVYTITSRRIVTDLLGAKALSRYGVRVECFAFKTADLELLSDTLVTLHGGDATNNTKWVWVEGESESYDPPPQQNEQVPHSVVLDMVIWI